MSKRYQPRVVEAKKLEDPNKQGLFDIMVTLHDANRVRVSCSMDKETGQAKVDYVNRLYTVPCSVCRKDFLCNCLDHFKQTIFDQAIKMV
jgi:hypothetical protein